MERCEDCRYIRPPISQFAGHECAVMVDTLYPVSFMRREDGLCGPASKLFERNHVPNGKGKRAYD